MDEQQHPHPPTNGQTAEAHARYFAGLIRGSIGLRLTEATIHEVKQYLWRVGPENYEDLIASIFLECWSLHKTGTAITDQDVRKAADRVRQRLIRGTKRTPLTATSEIVPADDLPPDDEAILVLHEFRMFLEGRSSHDALLFQRYYLDGEKNITLLAEELHVSPATVYRKLKTIRDDFRALRDLKDPPHSA